MPTYFVIFLVAALAMSCSSTKPVVDPMPSVVRTASSSTVGALEEGRQAVWSVTPIEQLEIKRDRVCALRGGDIYCWRGHSDESFTLHKTGPFVRIAIPERFTVCATRPDARVVCGDTVSPVRDPHATLDASGDLLCAASGPSIHCELMDLEQQFEFETPDGEDVVSLATHDGQGTLLLAVTSSGALYGWSNLRDETFGPDRIESPPLSLVRRVQYGWAGITTDAGVVFSGGEFGHQHGVYEVCGIENAVDVRIAMKQVCAQTPEGVVCWKRSYLTEKNFRIGPLHEPCVGPRGKMARDDVVHIADAPLSSLCIATASNEVECMKTRPKWSRARPVVHEGAVQIASGYHFNCALLEDGRVECVGPTSLLEGLELRELRGSSAIYAGEHLVCGVVGAELRCLFATTDEDSTITWQPIRPAKLPVEPESVLVRDRIVSSEANGRVYSYRIMLPYRDKMLIGVLEPWTRRGPQRFKRGKPEKVSESDVELRSASGTYFLTEQGQIFRIRARNLNLAEVVFGVATGGIWLPVMKWNRPEHRTNIKTVPDAQELAAGVAHLCYRNTDGTVECFGSDLRGEVSGIPFDGRLESDKPFVHEFSSPVVQLTAGREHTCALHADGDVRCWGGWGTGLIREPDDYPGLSPVAWPPDSSSR